MATFTIYKDRSGDYRWRFKSSNGRIIADSAEGYETKRACERGIAIVKSDAPSAPTRDET